MVQQLLLSITAHHLLSFTRPYPIARGCKRLVRAASVSEPRRTQPRRRVGPSGSSPSTLRPASSTGSSPGRGRRVGDDDVGHDALAVDPASCPASATWRSSAGSRRCRPRAASTAGRCPCRTSWSRRASPGRGRGARPPRSRTRTRSRRRRGRRAGSTGRSRGPAGLGGRLGQVAVGVLLPEDRSRRRGTRWRSSRAAVTNPPGLPRRSRMSCCWPAATSPGAPRRTASAAWSEKPASLM